MLFPISKTRIDAFASDLDDFDDVLRPASSPGRDLALAWHYLNVEAFSHARRHALRVLLWAREIRRPEHTPFFDWLPFSALLLAGFESEANEQGDELVRYLLARDDWTIDVEKITVILLKQKYDFFVDLLIQLYSKHKQSFMKLKYDFRTKITPRIIYDFCKAIVKKEYPIAFKFMETIMHSTDDPATIYNKFSFLLFAMVKTLVESGFDCGESGRTYKAWREWIAQHPPGEQVTAEEEKKWRTPIKQAPKPAIAPAPPPQISPRDVEPEKLHDGPVMYTEDIGYCFTTVTQLLDIPARDHFSEEGAFQDECEVDLTIEDILGNEAMEGGRLPRKFGDKLGAEQLVARFKSNAAFQECLRHLAMHGDIFTVEQPEDKHGRILDVIQKQLPDALSNRILDAVSKPEIMRIAFDDQELRSVVVPAMERAIARETGQRGGSSKNRPAPNTRLDGYIADQLKTLITTARRFLDEHEDVLLLICSEL
jgi:hypothetical protein